MSELKILSWNVAKRLKRVEGQVSFIERFNPDIIALQEVIPSTEKQFHFRLKKAYPYRVSSFELAPDQTILKRARMFGQLICSKSPLEPFSPTIMPVPWQERVLSVRVCHSDITFDLHTTHIPPGVSNKWIKIEMIEGIIGYLVQNPRGQLLCGDFNTPKAEFENHGLVTFGQNIDKTGRVKTKRKFRGGSGAAWDAGERCLFESLPKHGITDSFRKLHPDDFGAYSWLYRRGEKSFTFRFDHFFASEDLQPISCAYQNNQGELSDHSPILAVYKLS